MVHDARIGLHTDSSLSDGDLLRHVELPGYDAPAITDHADASNPDGPDASLLCLARDGAGESGVRFVPGAELTHVPPPQIAGLRRAPELGALLTSANSTYLELTSRGGCCPTNCHVAGIVLLTGARLFVNTDTCRPHDMMGQADVGAGLGEDEVEVAPDTHALELLATALER